VKPLNKVYDRERNGPPPYESKGCRRTNGIVNLNLALPADADTGAQYELHVVYTYVSGINFSAGSAEVLF